MLFKTNSPPGKIIIFAFHLPQLFHWSCSFCDYLAFFPFHPAMVWEMSRNLQGIQSVCVCVCKFVFIYLFEMQSERERHIRYTSCKATKSSSQIKNTPPPKKKFLCRCEWPVFWGHSQLFVVPIPMMTVTDRCGIKSSHFFWEAPNFSSKDDARISEFISIASK